MKIIPKLFVIVLALFLELVVFEFGSLIIFGPGHGQIVDTRYRQKERIAAFNDYEYHRSPENTARFQEELRLMHKHEDWKLYLALGLFVVVNGAGIYYYWNYGNRKALA